jgi:predicted  nucleic acid-binding Zn-ribbon protein
MTSVSQLKPSASQMSQMSGRTYISQLQKQLDTEKEARQKLEGELDDLKKISSEITSQLSQI